METTLNIIIICLLTIDLCINLGIIKISYTITNRKNKKLI